MLLLCFFDTQSVWFIIRLSNMLVIVKYLMSTRTLKSCARKQCMGLLHTNHALSSL